MALVMNRGQEEKGGDRKPFSTWCLKLRESGASAAHVQGIHWTAAAVRQCLLVIRLVRDELRLACKVDESRRQQQGAVTKVRSQVGQFSS